jgi:uncharacterized protein
MILLDTTLLLYAAGSDHPLQAPCSRLIEAIGAGRLAATTTVEALQEFVHVYVRRPGRNRVSGAEIAGAFVDLLSPLVQPDQTDLTKGLDLWVRYERLGCFDAVLAATALQRDHITGLASADRAFGTVSGLVHHDPENADFLAQLGID